MNGTEIDITNSSLHRYIFLVIFLKKLYDLKLVIVFMQGTVDRLLVSWRNFGIVNGKNVDTRVFINKNS